MHVQCRVDNSNFICFFTIRVSRMNRCERRTSLLSLSRLSSPVDSWWFRRWCVFSVAVGAICQVVRSVLFCLRSGRSDESTTVVRLLAFLLCSCFGVSAERVLQFCPSRPSAFVTSSGRGVMCG